MSRYAHEQMNIVTDETGSGSMSAPLVFALEGKKAPTVIGKPNTTMMDAIIAE
jgi:ribonucleotide monophosphatase NagD (HAD superfamily)